VARKDSKPLKLEKTMLYSPCGENSTSSQHKLSQRALMP